MEKTYSYDCFVKVTILIITDFLMSETQKPITTLKPGLVDKSGRSVQLYQ